MGILYSEPICSAAYNDDFNQVYQLLAENALSLNVQDKVFGDTAIIAACRSGSIRVAKFLLSKNADVSIRNKKERTCLHYIAKKRFSFLDYLMIIILMPILLIGYFVMMEKQKKHVSLMRLILSSGVEVDAVDNKGNTALHYACLSKSHKIIPLLLEKNADISIKNKVSF
uniref:Ankyrin repeat domain 22 n=1 Tax=Astyanax mexicanus TaxID=7994 RepID=A0A8B9HAY3_ASTMX